MKMRATLAAAFCAIAIAGVRAQDDGAIWTALLHKAEENLACLIDSGPTNVDAKNFIEKGLAN